MENKNYISSGADICEIIRCGKLDAAYDLLDKKEINKRNAINIICSVAQTCYGNLNGSLRIDSNNKVFDILIKITRFIDTTEKSQLIRYIQSIFHICKFFIEKECYEYLSKIEHVIIIENISDTKSIEKAKVMYEQLIAMLYNSVNKLLKTNNNTYIKYLPEIIKIILKTKIEIHCYITTLNLAKSLASNLFLLAGNMNVNDVIQKIYINILDIFVCKSTTTDHLEILLEIYSQFTIMSFTLNDYTQTKLFIDHINVYLTNKVKKDQCTYCHDLCFDILNIFLPSSNEKVLINDVKKRLKTFKKSNKEFFHKFQTIILCSLYYLIDHYNKNEWVNWKGINTTSLINLIQFLKDDILLIPDQASSNTILRTTLIASNFCTALRIHLKSNNDISESYCNHCFDFIKYLLTFIEQKLKNNNIEKYKQFYDNTIVTLFNFGIATSNLQYNYSLPFFKYKLKSIYTFKESLESVKYIKDSFSAICVKYYNLEEYELSMAYAALQCLLHTNTSELNVSMVWWVKSKGKLRTQPDIHNLTMIEILEKYNNELNDIVNLFDHLTKENRIKLLKCELHIYLCNYKSKMPILTTLTQLYQIADMPELINILIDEFCNDIETNLACDNSSILFEIYNALGKYLTNSSSTNGYFALGIISYLYYKTLRIISITESVEEVNETIKFVENANGKLDPEPVPKDKNDQCDIVSVYRNLILHKFMDILDYLNHALKYFISSENRNLDEKYLRKLIILLIDIGHEYRLQQFSYKSLNAFNASYTFSKLIQDHNNQLVSISFLIESANVNRSNVKLLIEEGDKLVQLLQDDNIDLYRPTIIIYYIFKANAYLYETIEISYDSWKKAKQLYDECSSKNTNDYQYLYCKILMLQFKFMTSYEHIAEQYSNQSPALKLHDAMNLVVGSNCHVSCTINPFQMKILFEVTHAVTKYYLTMRLPRDLRMYSKNIIFLAQKLLLPMTTVSFLILLAHCDILTDKLNDGNTKLNGIEEILYLNDDDNSNDIDIVTEQIEKISVNDEKVSLQSDSPIASYLVPEHFKSPKFLSHNVTCTCLYCMSMEIQLVWLQVIHLKALKFMYAKDKQTIHVFINGFMKVYETVQTNYLNSKLKFKQILQRVSLYNFSHKSMEIYVNFANDYSLHLSRMNKHSEALDINTQCIIHLKKRQSEFLHLYADTLIHRLTFVQGIKENNNKCTWKPLSSTTESTTTALSSDNNWKTPQNGKSYVTIKPSVDTDDFTPSKNNRPLAKCALFKTPTVSSNILKVKKFNGIQQDSPFAKPFALDRTPLPKKPSIPSVTITNCENDEKIIAGTNRIVKSNNRSGNKATPSVSSTRKTTRTENSKKSATKREKSGHTMTAAEQLKEKVKKSVKKLPKMEYDLENVSIISNSPERETSQRVTRSLARQLKTASLKKDKTTKDNGTHTSAGYRRKLL